MMLRGKPVAHWDTRVRSWVEGRCRDVPFNWVTSRGKPRCVRCTIPLDEVEARKELRDKVSACSDCFEFVRLFVKELPRT
jgi:hypothetical protein